MPKYTAICCVCNTEDGKYKCSACRSTYYCSKECAVNDWKKHKNVCKLITKDIKQILYKCTQKFENFINSNKRSIYNELSKNKFNPNYSFLYFNTPIDITDDLKSYKKVSLLDIDNLNPNDDSSNPNVLYYAIVDNDPEVINEFSKSKDPKDKQIFDIFCLYNTYAQDKNNTVIYTYILKDGKYSYNLQISEIV